MTRNRTLAKRNMATELHPMSATSLSVDVKSRSAAKRDDAILQPPRHHRTSGPSVKRHSRSCCWCSRRAARSLHYIRVSEPRKTLRRRLTADLTRDALSRDAQEAEEAGDGRAVGLCREDAGQY
ncbi:hypothetical protein LshimejAT787_0411770 [Lyophyllum shimeji]|uniref:Uncharacterized protein n=1 Tax=Lyophyllum shimeji TaxID=47721 RepID=A0A9P3UPB3_LYOSH|nr:hypothetical protein LshimejAT787_0411770 [Lyophyllum shimeji]